VTRHASGGFPVVPPPLRRLWLRLSRALRRAGKVSVGTLAGALACAVTAVEPS